MYLGAKRFLARVVVEWFAKVDEVPLLVEYVTMLGVFREVLVKDSIAFIVFVVKFVELVVPRIVVGIEELVVSFVVVMEPCKNHEVVMAPISFVAHVSIVKVLVVKVLEVFVVPIIVVVIAFVDRQFVAPISFGIPIVVLIALVVW